MSTELSQRKILFVHMYTSRPDPSLTSLLTRWATHCSTTTTITTTITYHYYYYCRPAAAPRAMCPRAFY